MRRRQTAAAGATPIRTRESQVKKAEKSQVLLRVLSFCIQVDAKLRRDCLFEKHGLCCEFVVGTSACQRFLGRRRVWTRGTGGMLTLSGPIA